MYLLSRRQKLISCLSSALYALSLQSGIALAADKESSLSTTLTPVPATDGQEISQLLVHQVLDGGELVAGETLVEIRHHSYNLPTVAKTLEQLAVADACGDMAVQHRDIERGSELVRQWFAGRDSCEQIRIDYRVPADAAGAVAGVAPPVELRSEGGAVSGGATTFILRPESGHYRLSLDWDFSELATGAVGVSSLQAGSGELFPVTAFDDVFVMGGALGTYPQTLDEDGFYSAWQGDPEFDARALMQWARTLREQFTAFFAAPRSVYGVMLRYNPVNAGGGIGMHDSFVITYGEATADKLPELRSTLSHEMFHTYQPRLVSASGDQRDELALSWFNEGLAVFYQREFPFRAGMMSEQEYVDDLNFHAARYYTSIMQEAPNSAVPDGFWRDTRIRTLPYDRGFLYFATVDEAVRKASGNTRSLDDLVKALRNTMDSGERLTPQHWEAMLQKELGADAVEAFRAMLAGAPPLPSADAFGPCFKRTQVALRRYQLGFEPEVLTEPVRRVRGLIAASAAAQAGLREGDIILKPVPQDAIQGTQDARLTLHVQRGESVFDISYLPRGEIVPAWQWQLRSDAVPGQCSRR
ncbi:peptidase M61 [Parahaliea aestuarii]|uniref:Peptidase M61 n=1 Tax=Parahaliea aestuarii TaxID=1852021 RepID=A0A5C8ZSZ6_9GAMM|nr:peptidase M61 [Parahaliea aestuarii]TXS91545.1 peptidase M61 [Parahaliea aestuarii]